MIRVATFATHQLSLAQQMRTQADWELANIQASSGQQSQDYAGVAIYSAGDGHHAFTFALPSDETLIASSSVTLVQAMIDRISNGGPSLSDDARLMDLIRKVDGQSAWMVTEDVQFQMNGKWGGFSRPPGCRPSSFAAR